MATTQAWRDLITEYDENSREWNKRFGPPSKLTMSYKEEIRALKEEIARLRAENCLLLKQQSTILTGWY